MDSKESSSQGGSNDTTTNSTMTNAPPGPYHQVIKNLKILFLGAPGYPELVFQFPEGDFTFGGMIAGKKV